MLLTHRLDVCPQRLQVGLRGQGVGKTLLDPRQFLPGNCCRNLLPRTFVLGNQFGFYEGVPIEFSDFRFETNTSQQILKNGVQVLRDLGRGVYLDAGVTYTSFLEDAFVEDYVSADAGIAFRLRETSSLRIGYHGDYSDEFTTHGGNASLFLGF